MSALPRSAARAHRIAERAVKAGGVLGGVGHDAGVDVAVRLQRGADGADAPVHHVAGRDHIDPGGGMGQRLVHQHLDGDVVHDIAVSSKMPSWPWLV